MQRPPRMKPLTHGPREPTADPRIATMEAILETHDDSIAKLANAIEISNERLSKSIETSNDKLTRAMEASNYRLENKLDGLADSTAKAKQTNWPILLTIASMSLTVTGMVAGLVWFTIRQETSYLREGVSTLAKELMDHEKGEGHAFALKELARINEKFSSYDAKVDAHDKRFWELDDKIQKEFNGAISTVKEQVRSLDDKLQLEINNGKDAATNNSTVNRAAIAEIKDWISRRELLYSPMNAAQDERLRSLERKVFTTPNQEQKP